MEETVKAVATTILEPASAGLLLKTGALRFAQGDMMNRPATAAKVVSRFPKL